MLKSMTGFGAAQKEDESYKITVEIKAVNQRFLEVAFHMAHPLYPYEDLLRREIRKVVSRGKVDVFLTCEDSGTRAAPWRSTGSWLSRTIRLSRNSAISCILPGPTRS